ncbi:GH15 family glucan-1,4-alpha-glucosidase [Rhodoblastus acidophilus]|uniref:glycoside hydrolase family 15 protein n=1 Tax=Rhodoblastus acidophilus TaxID=1074 RepID=UPI0022241923|nr:glycoside hydrolase family 15 protein [Rhodoblastus acidophilus]MCW2285913.1 GH15 family glucan-1,4-alpha-glucosidase [Rhodoblastus acidophilus]MCW2334786.1 GH15 family glucan-1,4-alpha-glucosidase [Rhodoblastus acidophilus]
MPSAIEDYGLIGDCETAALVAKDGSIDWLCWPRFDSGACFAALLGDADNGRWRLAPADPKPTVTRRYRPDTLILETTFVTQEGEATLIDFFPLRAGASSLVRLVRGERGAVRMRCDLTLRFDHGAAIPWVRRTADGAWLAVSGPDQVALHTAVALRGEGMTTVAEFTVHAGHTAPFVLSYAPSHLPVPDPVDAFQALRDTEAFWRDWASAHHKHGHPDAWRDALARSLITLKALIYAPTGGIVAAPTTSLPEKIGGPRNWDYRICWLRDATLALLAFMNAGYYEEAREWRKWLLRAAAGSPSQMQIMYGLAGEKRLTEWEIPWLSGYEGSKPVRIGNAASEQLQIDVYGEVMDALHQARIGSLRNPGEGWDFQCALVEHLSKIWESPDEGIWEVRGGRQNFTHSKVMAWVAIDRAIRSAENFGLDGPLDQWRALRQHMHRQVCEKGFDPEIGAFVQTYGSKNLDASALLIPAVGFLPPDDPRVTGTIAAIERRLMRDGFVMRYHTHETDDGLPPGEGAFLACSFWLADAYVLTGRRAEAKKLFERLLALRNDLGLLSEEYDPGAKRFLGNFPQAFSHIALVNTAHNLLSQSRPRPHGARPPPHGRA